MMSCAASSCMSMGFVHILAVVGFLVSLMQSSQGSRPQILSEKYVKSKGFNHPGASCA